jgi:type IV secretory pathway VirB6-like protein
MDLFSVMGKENCMFFYILSVISLVLFAITIVTGIFYTKNKLSVVLLSSLGPLVTYYMYRLFYSMCEQSLQ